jgi:hypothetical protein
MRRHKKISFLKEPMQSYVVPCLKIGQFAVTARRADNFYRKNRDSCVFIALSIHECYRKNYSNLALFGQMFAFLFKARAMPSPEARLSAPLLGSVNHHSETAHCS